jgi:4-amino-4-deoxy-L-arabinose transferase-like glycosyltransferase
MVQTALKKWELIVLGLILLISLFCRLYRISDYMTFLGDEGRDVLVIRDIVTLKHFPLIGPGTSVGNMYLGPLYYYLVSPSLIISHLSPVGPAVEVALIGVLTVFLLWWVGRSWFKHPLTPLLLSLLYGLSPAVIVYSRSSWNPNIMPFFALMAIYSLWQIWQRWQSKWLYVLFISLAFVLNSHYLGLLLFPTVFVFLFLSKKIVFSKFDILYSLFVFLLLMSPLLFFDLRHNWTNFHALQSFFTDRQNTVNLKAYKAIPNLWPIWEDLILKLLAPGLPLILSLGSLFIFLRRKFTPEFILVLVWLFVGLIGLGLYKQHIYVHYYGFLFPAPFLLLGFLMDKLSRLRGIVFLSLVIYFLFTSPFRSSANFQLQRTRDIAEFITQDTADRPFNLGLLSDHNYDAGYRYFLSQANTPYFTVHDRVTDRLYVICEGAACQPVGSPLWEIAAFGWTKIDREWSFPWDTKLYLLSHYEK